VPSRKPICGLLLLLCLAPGSTLLAAPAGDPLAARSRFFAHAEPGRPWLFPTDAKGYFAPPPEEEIPNDKYGDEVRLGRLIVTNTPRYAARYSGNGLSCSNCHLDAGRRPNAIPFWGAVGMYPAYRARSDRNDNLADRIQACFKFSMNGIAPAHDAPEMRALLSYMHFISRGAPIGVNLPGRGLPDDVNYTGYEPSPSRGKDLFAARCAACHSADGGGIRREEGGYAVPPLWGWDSYNKGAGLATNDKLARFLKANMPVGQEGTLTDQEAIDIAAFVNLHERPLDPSRGLLRQWLR
jgi:thiosulfate dehydrogenase